MVENNTSHRDFISAKKVTIINHAENKEHPKVSGNYAILYVNVKDFSKFKPIDQKKHMNFLIQEFEGFVHCFNKSETEFFWTEYRGGDVLFLINTILTDDKRLLIGFLLGLRLQIFSAQKGFRLPSARPNPVFCEVLEPPRRIRRTV